MAGWLSSKLKVAEDFLQQIDQQASESFGRKEQLHIDKLNDRSPERSAGVVSLMDQLKKKTRGDDFIGKSQNDSNLNSRSDINSGKKTISVTSPEIAILSSPRPALVDSDWAELLNSPSESSLSQWAYGNRLSATQSSRKIVGRQRSFSSRNLNPRKLKNGSNVAALKSVTKPESVGGADMFSGNTFIGDPGSSSGHAFDSDSSSSGNTLNSSSRSSNMDANTERSLDGKQISYNATSSDIPNELKHESTPSGTGSLQKSPKLHPMNIRTSVLSPKFDGNGPPSLCSPLTVGNMKSSGQECSTVVIRKPSSPSSNGRLDSDAGSSSSSSSDSSEEENEESKRRREEIMLARAKARAACAIKEREDVVARLEGEKEFLEKVLAEQLKQQAQEASDLQLSTMETVEAAEKEKQKHNSTRMEALARVAKLEISNADLAKSLASAQRNLELLANQVLELRQQAGFKQMLLGELNKEISSAHQARPSVDQVPVRKEVKLEWEMQKAEYVFLDDKVKQLQSKAKTLEESIERMRKGMENPTEVEIELRRRLGQFTDHLIQKQAQVEALSSQKAMLLLRIEAAKDDISSPPLAIDLESGNWSLPDSNLRPLLPGHLQLAQKHMMSLLRRLDTVFSLRRSSNVKTCFVVYLVLLHFWAIYIFMRDSTNSDEMKSSGIMSLENINRTADV